MSFLIRFFSITAVLILSIMCGMGATYYIDFSGGNDASNGTSTTTAWKRHPFMKGFAGSYSRTAGDRFIFKGGVVWTGSFPMTINVSGPSPSNRDYYGVDKNWFSGSSWTRPVFDGSGGGDNMILLGNSVSNIIIDGLELRNYSNALGIFCTAPTYTTLTNLYIHKWFRGSATTDGNKGGIYNNYAGVSGGRLTQFLVTHTIIDNSDGGQDFGVCIRGAGELAFSKLGYAPELLLHGGYSVHDSEFYHCTQSFLGDGAQHPNVAYLDNFDGTQVLPGGKVYFYNNLIRDIRAGNAVQLIYPNLGTGGLGNNGEMYIYNNVVVNAPNARTIPIDNYGAPGGAAYKFYVWNNTFENTQSGGSFISVVFRSGVPAPHTISYYNNHFIGSGSPYVASGTLNTFSGNNFQHTSAAAANSAGYTAAGFYAPPSSTALTVGTGANFASSTLAALAFDTSLGNRRTPKARPTIGPWDIGAYIFSGSAGSTNPVISVSPTILNFGTIAVGQISNLNLTVKNEGNSGPLTGSATVSAPFSIASGGSYSLATGATQVVTVRYGPTAAGNHSQNVAFTGGGGATAPVSGVAYPTMSGLSFGADAGAIVAPFVSSGGYIYQTVQTSLANGGRADYGFNISTAGEYVIEIVSDAPDESANSLFINIDAEPQDPSSIWHIPVTSGPERRTVSWQGAGAWNNPEFVPKKFNLSAGSHRLIIRGREANARLGQINLLPVTTAARPPTISNHPTNTTVNAGQTATFTVSASDTVPLSYQWQRNSANISGATAASYTTPVTVSNDNGAAFRAVITNAAGTITSDAAILTVLTPTAGVIGHWPFDEGSGLTVNDASGAARHGTLLQGTNWVTGIMGNGLRFTQANINDHVNLGTFSVSGNALTLSAWIKVDGIGIDPRIIAKSTGIAPGDQFWMLEIDDGPPHQLGFRVNTGGDAMRLTGGTVPTNQWIHVVGTYDGTTMRLYQNGAEVANSAKTGNLLTGTVPVWVGDNPLSNNRPFAGTIDEVRIYSKALTAVEVQDLFKAAPRPKPPKGVRVIK